MTVIDALWWQATKHLKEPFHATDCECQWGYFKDWAKEDCTTLMTRLVSILCTPGLSVEAAASVVPLEAFDQIFPDAPASAPYRLAVRHMIVMMGREGRKYDARVKLCFEGGPIAKNKGVSAAYTSLKRYKAWPIAERERLAGITFGDKTMCLLQAADLIAREGMKAALNLGIRPIRIPLQRLWQHLGVFVWGTPCLRELKDLGGYDSLGAITTLSSDCYLRGRMSDNPARVFQRIPV